ncbi:hypothetical protein SVIOM342S_10504 [Streptomyces violaceorubidus]
MRRRASAAPCLVQDQLLLEKLAHFNRERIPERVVHARGAGAYGTFTVTADVTRYTRAAFLSEVGKGDGDLPPLLHRGRQPGCGGLPSATRAASR